MTYDYETLYNKRIFADANAIVYHLQGMCQTAREIFRLIVGHTASRQCGLVTKDEMIRENYSHAVW
jgi:hypothetical protein